MIGAFSLGPGGCPQCWNPLVAGNRVGAWWTSKLWSRLALLSIPYDNATVEPELAESWESNEDATQWTVYLRKGLEWDDGEPLTVILRGETFHRGDRLLGERLGECFAAHHLHDVIERPVRTPAELVDRDDVRVLELTGQL